MNVKQLRDELNLLIEQGHEDTEVKYAYLAGDYWRTTIASTIIGITEAHVAYSKYHEKDEVLPEIEDGEEYPHNARKIFILE